MDDVTEDALATAQSQHVDDVTEDALASSGPHVVDVTEDVLATEEVTALHYE